MSTSKTHVCPWWFIHSFDNPIRKLFHNGERMLRPWIKPGQTVIDIGCGAGFFTITMARLAGSNGRVFAVDVQPEMLWGVQRRAEKAGIADRIKLVQVSDKGLDLDEKADFILAFWMLHEVPDQRTFLEQVHSLLTSNGRFLLVEPKLHVSAQRFQESMKIAESAGLKMIQQEEIRLSRAILFSSSLNLT